MKRQRGFTLLETLAALAVLAICATTIIGGVSQGAASMRRLAVSNQLDQAGKSLMDALTASPLTVGRQDGYLNDIRWYSNIALIPSAHTTLELYRIDLTLEACKRKIRLSTLQARVGTTRK